MINASDPVKLFGKIFSGNTNLDNSGSSLPAFFSKANLKLNIISISPVVLKKIINVPESHKMSGPDC